MYRCNHFTIGLKKLASYKVKFPHPIGIVIGIGVEFGSNCVVYIKMLLLVLKDMS